MSIYKVKGEVMETKAERRERKKRNRRKMKVTGRSIFVIQETILKAAEEAKNGKSK
jgi:hypothetical protein